ncbi:MAG: hypothetical protein KAI66_00955, partial [Lentisphaeria bacterium]|nr:hypothetical protein [Lentisphaeria bacterium]
MTKRSVCLGLVGAALVCGLCFFNDWVLRQNYLVGNNMPASIYGLLILAVVLLNPLLRRFRLTGAELAVILALTLAGASIPGGGLVRTLVPTLVMPHHLVKTHAGWRQEKILDSVPPRMLVDVSSDEDTVVNGYVQGLGKGDEHISVDRVPWRAWLVPLGFWLPMALALWVALIGLSLAIHPQWSRHEHLPFPIAQFTAALLPEPGERTSPLMRNRMFWTTVCVVLAIHMNNFACQWFPDFLIAIPTYFDLRPLAKLLPVLVRGGGAGLLRPHIYLIIIGLAYFIPSDVSLSFGVGPFLWYILLGVFATYGVNLTAPVEGVSYFSLKPQSFALFGANVGVLLAVVYTGRRYYRSVLGQALGSRGGDPVDASALWGMRVFLVACALLVFQLWLIGIELPLVLMYVGFMIMGFVVLSRIIAETGLIYLKCYFWPGATLWAFFGAQAVGPWQLLLMMLVTTVLFIDPREA